jgi:hypothetical protein
LVTVLTYCTLGSGVVTLAGRIVRWVEHLLLIVLVIVLLSIINPLGRSAAGVAHGATGDGSVCSIDSGLADDLAGLLPDVGAIYRTAVAYPLQKARGDITDPDLLEFYDGYLEAIGFAVEP